MQREQSHPTGFFAYLEAFFSNWMTGLSGPASVPLAVLAVYEPSVSLKFIFGAFAIAAGVSASYQVWLGERRELLAALGDLEGARRVPRPLELYAEIAGEAPLQRLKLTANPAVDLLWIGYQTKDGATVVREEARLNGSEIEARLSQASLNQLTVDAPVAASLGYTMPANIAFTVRPQGGVPNEFVLPVHLKDAWITKDGASSGFIEVSGSKTF